MAIVPLVAIAIYLIVSNLALAYNLHEQNLQSSTEMQAGILEENINVLMARASRFAASPAVKRVCVTNSTETADAEGFSKDVLNFTDETLDSVEVLALVGMDETILYSSGSNSDTTALSAILPELSLMENEEQRVQELLVGERGGSLVIIIPVKENKQVVGNFLVVCRTDYFLRAISSHKQMKDSNAFIYCKSHDATVISKMEIPHDLPELSKKMWENEQGSELCSVGGEYSLIYYRQIPKTPWMMINMLPTRQILSQVGRYGLVNGVTLLIVLLVVLFLSRRQSIRMLRPLKLLLDAVGQFFVSGAKGFQPPELDAGTEIAYLADKFAGISTEVSTAQDQLRESTYLYNTLLEATYEFRLIIDLPTDRIHCTLEALAERLQKPEGASAPERVLAFFAGKDGLPQEMAEVLHTIVFGLLSEPMEAEVCCNMGKYREEVWYRLVAVPIDTETEDECARKVVIHFENVTQEKQEEFRLIRSSQVDPLCGLLNKTAFPLHCRLSEQGKMDALFFIDLDYFKLVNDKLGHTAGDEMLIAAAKVIREQFREGDAIGRFGGDEFVVFAPHMNYEMTEKRASELVAGLCFHRVAGAMQINVTASVGVCMVSRPMELTQAIQLADEAMYHAKENGKSQYYIK